MFQWKSSRHKFKGQQVSLPWHGNREDSKYCSNLEEEGKKVTFAAYIAEASASFVVKPRSLSL